PEAWTVPPGRGSYQEWRRPGDTEKDCSAAVGGPRLEGRLHVFSTNALPFEAGQNYSPFFAYALLHHHGDFRAAAKALGEQGYGEPAGQTKERRHHEPGKTEVTAREKP